MPSAHDAGPWITAYCDGGSRGNPGPAGYGVRLEDANGRKIEELYEFLGVRTNNFAEYCGLLAALEFALAGGYTHLRVVADSELMVKQMQGRYRVKSPDLRPLYEEARRRIARLDGFRIEHVLRGKNKHADRLANLAMDKGTHRTVRDLHPGSSAPAPRKNTSSGAPTTGSLFAEQAPAQPPTPAAPVRGFVRNGVVHFVDDPLPDGTRVTITPAGKSTT